MTYRSTWPSSSRPGESLQSCQRPSNPFTGLPTYRGVPVIGFQTTRPQGGPFAVISSKSLALEDRSARNDKRRITDGPQDFEGRSTFMEEHQSICLSRKGTCPGKRGYRGKKRRRVKITPKAEELHKPN